METTKSKDLKKVLNILSKDKGCVKGIFTNHNSNLDLCVEYDGSCYILFHPDFKSYGDIKVGGFNYLCDIRCFGCNNNMELSEIKFRHFMTDLLKLTAECKSCKFEILTACTVEKGYQMYNFIESLSKLHLYYDYIHLNKDDIKLIPHVIKYVKNTMMQRVIKDIRDRNITISIVIEDEMIYSAKYSPDKIEIIDDIIKINGKYINNFLEPITE